MAGDKLTRTWYALHTKSRFENVVNDGLANKALDVFLPKITVKSQRRDRHKMIRVPLFPGYLFVRLVQHFILTEIYDTEKNKITNEKCN